MFYLRVTRRLSASRLMRMGSRANCKAYNLLLTPNMLANLLNEYKKRCCWINGCFYDVGSRSKSKLALWTWTRVIVSREGPDGTLGVDDEQPVAGRSPGLARELNVPQRLYVGGRPHASSGVTTGFVGAIQRVSALRLCTLLVL